MKRNLFVILFWLLCKQKFGLILQPNSGDEKKTNERKLELYTFGSTRLKRLRNSLKNQDDLLENIGKWMGYYNVESIYDQFNQDDMNLIGQKYENVVKKIDRMKVLLRERLQEFYTKYVQMPLMGNYAYWDLTTPITLH